MQTAYFYQAYFAIKVYCIYLDLEEETSKLGMEINENKTKYMVTSTYEHTRNAGGL